jgi:hypothetical protein
MSSGDCLDVVKLRGKVIECCWLLSPLSSRACHRLARASSKTGNDIFFFNQLRDLATRFPRTLRLAKQIIP